MYCGQTFVPRAAFAADRSRKGHITTISTTSHITDFFINPTMPKDKSEKKRKETVADVSGDIHMGDDTTERVRRKTTLSSFSAADTEI